MKTACALLLLAALGCVHAQPGDPLKSAGCGSALAELQAARRAGAAAATVEPLRSTAAAACLGTAVQPQRPSRTAQPPIVVPPPRIEIPQQAAPPPGPALPAPPVAIERPATPALCDPGGCWTNDGTHLRQVPPGLAGPRGLCSTVGTLVYCP